MHRPRIIREIVYIGAFVALLGACAQTSAPSRKTVEAPGSGLSSDEYGAEIIRLQRIILNTAEPPQKKAAHFQLAYLYLSADNPERNYQKALEQFRAYASLEGSRKEPAEERDWMAALTEMESLLNENDLQRGTILELEQKLKKSMQAQLALNKKNAKLTQANQDLANSNLKLEQTIETLKTFDRRLEEKRKNFSR